jgi:hypothetical protein
VILKMRKIVVLRCFWFVIECEMIELMMKIIKFLKIYFLSN